MKVVLKMKLTVAGRRMAAAQRKSKVKLTMFCECSCYKCHGASTSIKKRKDVKKVPSGEKEISNFESDLYRTLHGWQGKHGDFDT